MLKYLTKQLLVQSINYRLQAEVMAMQYYLNLSEAERESFFQLFKETYSEHSTVYRTLLNKQHSHWNFNKQQRYYILFFILRYLPASQQAELLQYELLDVIQKYKQWAGKFFFISSEEISDAHVCSMYERYLKKLAELDKHTSQWFSSESFEEADRNEIIQSVKYVCHREVINSMQNFQKDVEIIREKGKYRLNKVIYNEHFFGKKIKINAYVAKLEFPSDNLALPTLRSQYASVLRAYITQTLLKLEQTNIGKEIQETLLAQDLEASMQHYKNTQTASRQVDISIQLQGRGGAVSADIYQISVVKSIRKAFDKAGWWSITIMMSLIFGLIVIPLCLLIVALIIHFSPTSLSFLVGLLGVIWILYWIAKRQQDKSFERYPIADLTDSAKEFRNVYLEIVKEKKHETSQNSPEQFSFDIFRTYAKLAENFLT